LATEDQRDEELRSAGGCGPGGISWRALAVGLLGAIYFACNGPGVGNCNHLPGGSILIVLLVVVLVNPVASFVRLRRFTPLELAVIFNVVTVGILVTILPVYYVPHVIGPYYYATPENGWERVLFPLYPEHLFVSEEGAVLQFFEGIRGVAVPWGAWLVPSAWWLAMMLLFCASSLFLASLLRRRWTDEERFTFPIVQVPVEIIASPPTGRSLNAFLRSRALWVGMAVPVFLHGIRGLHVHFPAVPDIPVQLSLGRFFTTRPWVEMQPFEGFYQTSVIGFAYLLPTEISASFWAFWLFYKLECLVGGILGVPMPTAPGYVARRFGQSQEIGGSLALIGTMLWAGRGYFGGVWRAVRRQANGLADEEEPMGYRTAFAGLVACTVGMVAWCALGGIKWWVAVAVVAVFYVLMVVGSWAVCAGGLIFLQNSFSSFEVLRALTGTRVLGNQSIAMVTVLQRVLCFDLRELLMPSLLNGWRLGDESRASRRAMAWAMAAGISLTLFVSTAFLIWRPYVVGALKLGASENPWIYLNSPRQPSEVAASLIANPESPAWGQLPFIAGGALLVVAMMWLRVRVSWWPVHPVGFLVAGSWAMYTLWFSFLIGWLCKILTMRYGGPRLYQAIRPAFLGFILGETVMGTFWNIVTRITDVSYGVAVG
jgi:hypothetical protein